MTEIPTPKILGAWTIVQQLPRWTPVFQFARLPPRQPTRVADPGDRPDIGKSDGRRVLGPAAPR